MGDPVPFSAKSLASWVDRLQALARTGLYYTDSDYDRERYQRILDISAEMAGQVAGVTPLELQSNWVREAGYVTPKVGVGAAIFDNGNGLLLIKRPDSGLWGLPVGWSEVGETAARGIAREVREETGLLVRPQRVLGIYDSRLGGSSSLHHFYNIVFGCTVEGGALVKTAEALDVGYFPRDALPPLVRHHTPCILDAFESQERGWTEARFEL
jgi:ADP-ribose pyrophosphatase YjhB (NUDIX family)